MIYLNTLNLEGIEKYENNVYIRYSWKYRMFRKSNRKI